MSSIEIAIFLQFFLGLVAAVNPVGVMPVFVTLTSHMSEEEKNKTAITANLAVAIILVISLLAGQLLLDMFSISLDSFRVAGGLLLLSIAFSMMSGKLGEDKQNKQEKSEQKPNSQPSSKANKSKNTPCFGCVSRTNSIPPPQYVQVNGLRPATSSKNSA